MCSALGVGLMFVTMLSLLVLPVLAEEEGSGYISVGDSGGWGNIFAEVDATWDANGYITSAGLNSYTSGILQVRQHVNTGVLACAYIQAYFPIDGNARIAECWFSPSEPQKSGSWCGIVH